MFSLSAPHHLVLSTLLLTATSSSNLVNAAACYNDTQAMLMAQVAGETQLEICANTVLELGVPLSADLTQWSGQVPLVIIKDDVEVFCGADKKSSNNCVLKGGLLQLVTSVVNPLLPNVPTNSTHNLKVTGLTFEGTIASIPGLLDGASVAIGAPGTNIVLEDCVWTNINASHVVFVARNAFTSEAQFPLKSANVTIANSVFQDSTYGQEVIQNEGQIVTLSNVEFSNVNYAPLCDCPQSYLMELTDGSMTILQDLTFSNVECFTSLLLQANEGTELVYTNDDLSISGFSIYNMTDRNATEYCEGGLVVDSVVNGILDECVELNMDGGGDDKDDGEPATDGATTMTTTITSHGQLFLLSAVATMWLW